MAPWWQPYAGACAAVASVAGQSFDGLRLSLQDPARRPACGRVAAWLNEAATLVSPSAGTVRFEASPMGAATGGAAAYERRIHDERRVPTRDQFHDLCNGLVWLRFAALKHHLNALQMAAMRLADRQGPGTRAHALPPGRGPLRDALTLLDENGALWCGPEPLLQAWRARDWQRCFVGDRAAWRHARVLVIGHGLLDKLSTPRAAITAHAWPLQSPCPGEPDAEGGLDAAGVDALADQAVRALADPSAAQWLATKPFLPLPVLGVPGWWNPNRDPGFYSDSDVFRPLSHRPGAVRRQTSRFSRLSAKP